MLNQVRKGEWTGETFKLYFISGTYERKVGENSTEQEEMMTQLR